MPELSPINDFFEKVFEKRLARSPMLQTQLGIKTDYGKWDDLTDAAAQDGLKENKDDLKALQDQFDPNALSENERISYELFGLQAKAAVERFEFRFHDYPLNQMFGWQAEIPAFLINSHLVTSTADAEAYVERLKGTRELIAQLVDGIDVRVNRGILPPRFVFQYVIADCRGVLRGQPFHATEDKSPLLADFSSKVDALPIAEPEKQRLMRAAEDALLRYVQPAYQDLLMSAMRCESLAGTDDGTWHLPDGDSYYQLLLKQMTTTEMKADEIHALGLSEVHRIHDEMRGIMREVGFTGSLQDFFFWMKTQERFYLPDSAQGRNEYLRQVDTSISAMRARLDESFDLKPRAELLVKPVEAFREGSAGLAFYQAPAPDGSRPGTYYVNLSDMRQLPTYQRDALAFHEGVPGHHMQLGIATELKGVPQFQKFADYTAYSEGWGLYAELLAREMGFYQDPYDNFGRLALELWRACRLVVDTGLHFKRWTRQMAADYLRSTTPNPNTEIVRSIDRYIVMPAQATTYKIGMNRILEYRERARQTMGGRFSIQQFHNIVLGRGPLPLGTLGVLVDAWADGDHH